jgi:hypothetical protein
MLGQLTEVESYSKDSKEPAVQLWTEQRWRARAANPEIRREVEL